MRNIWAFHFIFVNVLFGIELCKYFIFVFPFSLDATYGTAFIFIRYRNRVFHRARILNFVTFRLKDFPLQVSKRLALLYGHPELGDIFKQILCSLIARPRVTHAPRILIPYFEKKIFKIKYEKYFLLKFDTCNWLYTIFTKDYIMISCIEIENNRPTILHIQWWCIIGWEAPLKNLKFNVTRYYRVDTPQKIWIAECS